MEHLIKDLTNVIIDLNRVKGQLNMPDPQVIFWSNGSGVREGKEQIRLNILAYNVGYMILSGELPIDKSTFREKFIGEQMAALRLGVSRLDPFVDESEFVLRRKSQKGDILIGLGGDKTHASEMKNTVVEIANKVFEVGMDVAWL